MRGQIVRVERQLANSRIWLEKADEGKRGSGIRSRLRSEQGSIRWMRVEPSPGEALSC